MGEELQPGVIARIVERLRMHTIQRIIRRREINWHNTSFERDSVRQASKLIRSDNIALAFSFGVTTAICIGLAVYFFGYRGGFLTRALRITVTNTFIVLTVILLIFTVLFSLLSHYLSHNERAEPQCRCQCLQPLLKCCPSLFISVRNLLPLRLFLQKPSGGPTASGHDIVNEENQNAQQGSDQASDLDALHVIPDYRDIPKIWIEGFENRAIDYGEGSDDSESTQAGPSGFAERSSSSFTSLNVAPTGIFDSIPTDFSPILPRKQPSTCSSKDFEMAVRSLPDTAHAFSDGHSNKIPVIGNLSGQSCGRAVGGEQAASGGQTSEETSQL